MSLAFQGHAADVAGTASRPTQQADIVGLLARVVPGFYDTVTSRQSWRHLAFGHKLTLRPGRNPARVPTWERRQEQRRRGPCSVIAAWPASTVCSSAMYAQRRCSPEHDE
jgi:hypothetical protein